YLTLSRSSAETLSRMVGDILDYSNLEAGALELECVAFDLPDCLDETLLALKFTAQAKGLELISDVSPDVPDRLRGDPVRIRQILTNLVGNAVKFTEGGRVVVTVRQQFRDGDDVRLLFCVRDTGIGISRENQSRIFDVFEQANAATAQKHGGVGLGLSLSLQLVHLMGGKVWLESEVGEGSAFSFTLPLRVSSDAPDILTSSPKDLAGVPVLVVDDNQTNRFLLEKILSHWEMRPTLTSGGAAALEALRDAWEKGNPFALVLLDVNMPEMDGFETARRIREDNRLAETTILMLSSVGQREHAERCRTLGISAYVTKPIRQAVLLHSILEVLNITPPVQKTTLPGGMYPDQSFHERLDLRVLLAEDDHVNQILAQNALEDLGCRITLVGNGREAIAVWENDSHDLILMDVQMPLMDGLEAARAIRDREQRRAANEHVPIIAMTAHALKGDRELCLQAGMDAYIAKPVQSDELLRVIQSTLQKLHAHAETNPGNNENREE
ncbi:MAG: response regulator, partial [Phycisphaerae bacterium]|nr:response regulator [Phycisphaerae bacterium]